MEYYCLSGVMKIANFENCSYIKNYFLKVLCGDVTRKLKTLRHFNILENQLILRFSIYGHILVAKNNLYNATCSL